MGVAWHGVEVCCVVVPHRSTTVTSPSPRSYLPHRTPPPTCRTSLKMHDDWSHAPKKPVSPNTCTATRHTSHTYLAIANPVQRKPPHPPPHHATPPPPSSPLDRRPGSRSHRTASRARAAIPQAKSRDRLAPRGGEAVRVIGTGVWGCAGAGHLLFCVD